MKKVFLGLVLLLSFVLNVHATSLRFIEQMKYEVDYKIALEKSKKTDKPIMMVVSQTTCPWCRKLERQTLKKDVIDTKIKEHFIPLSVDKDIMNYPKKFKAKVVPTIFFIHPTDESILLKVLGYKNKKEFNSILDKVIAQ